MSGRTCVVGRVGRRDDTLAKGTVRGPTVVFCGKALSQTGGHGDFRAAGENALASGRCVCCNNTIGRVCDGVTACREAVRDEVRKGASHIKIMASGGVASPTDRLENLQFSEVGRSINLLLLCITRTPKF